MPKTITHSKLATATTKKLVRANGLGELFKSQLAEQHAAPATALDLIKAAHARGPRRRVA